MAYRHRGAIAMTALAGAPVLMPLGIGLVILSTLKGGARDGLLLTAVAALVLSVLQLLLQSTVTLALSTAIVYWLPGVGLAVVLARTQSLSFCLQLLTLLGMVAAGLFWLIVEQPATWWLPLIEEAFVPFMAEISPQLDVSPMLPALARFFTGALIALWALTMATGLLLGRWWQGLLSEDRVFAREFQSHRQGYAIAAIAALVFVLAGLTGFALLQNLVLILIAMFMLQGLALAHWLVANKGMHTGWLFVVYVVLPFGAPWSVVMLAAIGFMDNWLRLRRQMPVQS